MKKAILISILFASISLANAQEKMGSWSAGLYSDIARKPFEKTSERGILEGFQAGFEANYKLKIPFAFTTGVEYWGSDGCIGIVGGARYYPHRNFFFRARGILLINRSALGAGWTKAIGKDWNIELLGDYYFKESVAARAGLSYNF